mgnify:CR=1 FL=1
MKFKSVAAALLAAVTCVSMAACGSGGDTNADGKVEITMWHNSTTGDGKAYWESAAKAFEKENPNVTIKIEAIQNEDMDGKLQTALQDPNSAPDIFMARGGQKLRDVVEAGQAMDLTDKISDTVKNQMATAEATGTIDGKIYSVQQSVLPGGIWYSKDLFEKAGITETPKTWDEFFALGDKVKDIDGRALFTYQGIYPGYMEEMLWPAIANECGEEALTKIANYEEGSFNNEGVLKALSHIKEIADKGYLLEGTVGMNHTESQTEMMLGKAAFITNGTWMENEMQDAPREDGFEFAMAPIPTENADDVHYVFDSCEQFSIPAAAKNPELAKEFLRFLYSDESVSAFAEASGALYATKSAREVAKDKLSTAIYNMYGIYEEANASSLIMSFAAVPADCKVNPKDEIFNPITSVMNDEMTVEEWAQNVEDAFAQVRADMEAAN